MYRRRLLGWAALQPGRSAATMADAYFRGETARIAAATFQGITTLEDWQARRARLRAQALEMLGLEPPPARSDLHATVTGTRETDRFKVEKLQFQSVPGLFVTANLYVPRGLAGPAPAVLYLCGHSRMVQDGVVYGNKTAYQHHPAWFAEHGYVALILDTVSLGEVGGEHHGTYRRGWWWWPTRGYTPAGVETWNAIRALDYLATRPEVDMSRVGVTGRSGGGAYTWFVAAADERPAVFAPVAGITDLRNHVVDRCVDGHCDCMYPVNTHGWDFPVLAALAAPRPLLLANTDADRIFPLDGVVRVHEALRRIYALHGAEKSLGLVVTPGPHADTQELQVAAFRWMNRWLRQDEGPVDAVAVKRFAPADLKVLTAVPAGAVNLSIHEVFVPAASPIAPPASRAAWDDMAGRWRAELRSRVFGRWPAPGPAPGEVRVVSETAAGGWRRRRIEFTADAAFRLPLVLELPERAGTGPLRLRVGGDENTLALGEPAAVVLPRGTGPTAWPAEELVSIRRRFLLLGQSLETMQVWDVRAALAVIAADPDAGRRPVVLEANGPLALVALFAALFEPGVTALDLTDLPASLAAASFPNALRVLDAPQLVALTLPRAITLRGSAPGAWSWTRAAARVAGGSVTLA